jgi:hypothetical protein
MEEGVRKRVQAGTRTLVSDPGSDTYRLCLQIGAFVSLGFGFLIWIIATNDLQAPSQVTSHE